VPRRAMRLHRASSLSSAPVDEECDGVRVAGGDAEFRVRYIGFDYEAALVAARYNGVVRRGSSVSMDVGFGVFAASRSRLLDLWNYSIDL
jgi:hypothetical protein